MAIDCFYDSLAITNYELVKLLNMAEVCELLIADHQLNDLLQLAPMPPHNNLIKIR